MRISLKVKNNNGGQCLQDKSREGKQEVDGDKYYIYRMEK